MLAYFTKATYTNGIYKISDFYTGDNYKLTPNRSLDILLEASDGVVITKPTSGILGDNTNVRDYTHMLVPSQNKIYRITKFVYVNINQTSMVLEEDPLLSNYKELEDKNIILERSSDPSDFIGIHDIPEINIKKSVTIDGISSNTNIIGKWALLFFRSDVDEITLNFENGVKVFTEVFDTFEDILEKYPEITNIDQPDLIPHYQKVVRIGNSVPTYHFYQFEYVPLNSGKGALRWVNVDEGLSPASIEIKPTKVSYSPYDTGYKVVAIPFSLNIVDSSSNRSPSFLTFISTDQAEFLESIKIIDSRELGELYTSPYSSVVSYNSTTRKMTIMPPQKTLTNHIIDNDDALWFTLDMIPLDGIHVDVSRSLPPNIYQYPPFRRYFLNVYGNKHEIHPSLFDKLKIQFIMTSGTSTYIIYYDHGTLNYSRNIIGSGSYTHQARFASDKLDEFLAQNPTYKDIFNANQDRIITKTLLGVLGSSAAGLFTGGPAGAIIAAAGSAGSIANTMIDLNHYQTTEKLKLEGLKLAPDSINGNISDLPVALASCFGIFWEIHTPSGYEQMILDLYKRGFPTLKIRKIKDINYILNTIYDYSKTISGQLLEIVKNQNATDEINRKLQQGIILVP